MTEPEAKEEQKGKFIVERQYVADRQITEPKELQVEGFDMSGRWGVLIEPRTITDFDHTLMKEVQRQPSGRHMNRCYQCGNCTAVCPVTAEDPVFNPRYFIHVVRMGYKSELEGVRANIYRCESCGRCSEVCPRQVDPSGVMAAIGTAIRNHP